VPAAVVQFSAERGARWTQGLEWREPAAPGVAPDSGALVVLDGWTAVFTVRRRPSDTAPLVVITDQDGITLGGDPENIVLTLSGSQTALLPVGENVYLLELIPPSGADDLERVAEGPFVVDGADG
jgi:hypothetical protein